MTTGTTLRRRPGLSTYPTLYRAFDRRARCCACHRNCAIDGARWRPRAGRGDRAACAAIKRDRPGRIFPIALRAALEMLVGVSGHWNRLDSEDPPGGVRSTARWTMRADECGGRSGTLPEPRRQGSPTRDLLGEDFQRRKGFVRRSGNRSAFPGRRFYSGTREGACPFFHSNPLAAPSGCSAQGSAVAAFQP